MSYNSGKRLLTLVYRGDRKAYRYFGVPPEEWEAFQAAQSKGTYLNEVFKGKGYRFETLERRSRYRA